VSRRRGLNTEMSNVRLASPASIPDHRTSLKSSNHRQMRLNLLRRRPAGCLRLSMVTLQAAEQPNGTATSHALNMAGANPLLLEILLMIILRAVKL
jgi:hypothetical protein